MSDLKQKNCITGDISYRLTARCGMEIHYIPSPFQTIYAVLGVKYGSFDTMLSDEAGEMSILPGSAHFLEHKMFDMPGGGDAFELFAACGATANAFTSHEYTAYLFSSTDGYLTALEALLQFLFHPSIHKSGVEKERGIIEMEMASYQDDASYRAYMLAMAQMYREHPIRSDIIGNRNSIRAITADDLNRIYRYFYRADNMVLTVVGRADIHEIEETVDRICGTIPPKSLVCRQLPENDSHEGAHNVQDTMDIPLSRVVIAYKNRNLCDPSETAQGYYLDIAAGCLFGRTSPLFKSLFESGLISRDFDAYYEWSWGAGHMILSFDTMAPDEVIRYIGEYLAHVQEHCPSKASFESMRSVFYADTLSVFDTVSDLALSNLEEVMCGGDYFLLPELIRNLSYEEFCQQINNLFKDNQPYTVTIKPMKKENEV